MATCFDEWDVILDSKFCLNAVSKNAKGTVKVAKVLPVVCGPKECATLRTLGPLTLTTVPNKPCDSKLSLGLQKGSFVVEKLATAYEIDGLHRGVHAGDFVWNHPQVRIEGRISGITNAGILRPPFKGECEACSTRGIMIGRLCGEVVGAETREWEGAQVVGVYRFAAGRPTKKGASGTVIGTIEGVIVEKC